MKRFIGLVFAVSLVLSSGPAFALPGLAEDSPVLTLNGDTVPGGLLELGVTVPGAPLKDMTVEITDEKGRPIHAFSGFRLPEGNEGAPAKWIALIGIPSDQVPGDYLLKVTIRRGAESFSFRRPVTIEERAFKTEDIALNKTMSELRSEQDPKKEEEARNFYELLLRVNPEALFHTGALVHPVGAFRETSDYGDRRTYKYSDGGNSKAVHQGIDFATPRGTPVFACGAGKVVFAKFLILTGNTIVIEHLPGLYSVYFHLDSLDAKVGRLVNAGEKIAASGATGLATGPHLHWELRVRGIAVDPRPFLKRSLLSEAKDF